MACLMDPGKTIVDSSHMRGPMQVQSVAGLVEVYGNDLGKRYELSEGIITIGRGDSNDIVLEMENVSRIHVKLSIKGSVVTLEDNKSTNGTFVNDEEAFNHIQLRSGDLVKVGGTIFKYISGGNIEGLYHEEIYRLTIIDGLTGAYNKRYFIETIEREMARCLRYDRPLSLIMFDIDHFKKVNDEYGHIAGDYVLRHMCQTIHGRIRQEEVFSRYGGEEFAIILPERSLDKAEQFAEKLRRLVESDMFAFEDEEITITISLGVAELSGHEKVTQLIRQADEALYQAKHNGRNQVCTG